MPYRGKAISNTKHSVNRFSIETEELKFLQEGQCYIFRELPSRIQEEIKLLTQLASESEDLEAQVLRHHLLVSLLYSLEREEKDLIRLPQSEHFQSFLKLEKELRSRMSEEIDLDQMAKVMKVSTSHFKLIFKRFAACSPGRFLIKMRMIEAASLIRGTDLPFKDVARRVGYKDDSAFFRAFKQHTGRTPRKHRFILKND